MANNHVIVDDDNRFSIDGATRLITNLTGNHPSVMQFDHNSEVLTFHMPRFMEGHDMSLCDEVKVLYKNTGSGTSASNRRVIADVETIKDLAIDEDENSIVFSWTIPEFATLYTGKIVFQFKFVCYGEPKDATPKFKLYTEQYSFIEVRPSLDLSENLDEQFPNLIDEIEARLRAFRNEAGGGGYILVADMNLSGSTNAPNKLSLPTVKNVDGSTTAPVRPKVLYVPEGFGGYKFWMACIVGSNSSQITSYYGNPSILCSNDMVTWVIPEGVNFPISAINNGFTDSDIHLVYNPDTALLEIWYRTVVITYAATAVSYESRTYRSTSPNGTEWSEFEVISYADSTNNTGYSGQQVCKNPVVIYENGVYKIWARSGGSDNNFDYYESVDGTNWKLKTSTNLKAVDLDIIYTDSGYEAFIYDTTNGEKICHSVSDDGIVWSDKIELFASGGGLMSWDGTKLGRASAIKANGNYYVFYTGAGMAGPQVGIGLTVSSVVDDVTSIRGYVSGEAISTTMSGLLQTLMPKLKEFDELVSGMDEWASNVEERLSTIEETINAMGEWASNVEERLSALEG